MVGLDDIAVLRTAVADVFVHEAVARWIVELVRSTRELDLVAIGSSVRGTLALNRAARAWAVLHSRRYVTPEDVEQLFVPVLLHRILFRPSFLAEIRDRGWALQPRTSANAASRWHRSRASTSTSTCRRQTTG